MADVHDTATRSYNMSRVKSRNTKPELLVRKYLFSQGFRYRVNARHLAGTPDIVLPKYKTVIFINGCFWHGHTGCKYFVIPGTRTEWWLNKINGNIKRDCDNSEVLHKLGWHVVTIWECQLKPLQRTATLTELAEIIRKNQQQP
jgi:DNA mismatch endonuclease (patch repair protein)